MRVVFMGTPELAATVMCSIADSFDVVGAFTRPDAVRGRGKTLMASPVKSAALDRGIPVFEAKTLRDGSAHDSIRSLAPDAIVVAACGILLPREVLQIPRLGCFNVHTSLLPRWRGAAPMQRAILARDEVTGVSIMRMEEGLDTGAYCKQAEVPLEGLYLDELQGILAQKGAELLIQALGEADAGTLEWTDQGETGVVYAEKIGKGELDLVPDEPASVSCAKVRASDSAHPAHAVIAGRAVTVERASVAADDAAAALAEGLSAGQAVFRAKRLLAVSGDGIIEIEGLKPQGKKSMDARSFAAGIQGAKKATLTWGRS